MLMKFAKDLLSLHELRASCARNSYENLVDCNLKLL